MSYFLDQFKVRRNINTCLTEYTRESFFHRVLNIGLRSFRTPDELMYLRLPFSHLFWSIKSLYHRHKRALFQNKKEKNENRSIFFYRGFEMSKEELRKLKKSIEQYIEMEGFISTSMCESFIDAFSVNAKMVIEVPTCNLGGMIDNGFAHISIFSCHKSEREVLFNAFNVFKIISLHSELDSYSQMMVYKLHLEYGSLKPIEEKVKKSEKLLDSEYMWICNCQELEKAKQALREHKK